MLGKGIRCGVWSSGDGGGQWVCGLGSGWDMPLVPLCEMHVMRVMRVLLSARYVLGTCSVVQAHKLQGSEVLQPG
jgi:hypothetical protein